MSNKINITNIVKGHLSTLNNANTGKVSAIDIFTFYLLPIFLSIVFYIFSLDLTKELVNIIVTAGSIFTGLLLNLLILVYDQKGKLPDVDTKNSKWKEIQLRHRILKETYFNIAYATLVSLLLVLFSVLQIVFKDTLINIQSLNIKDFDLSVALTSPIIIFLGVHLVLTLLMILKRIFTLLTTEK